MANGDVETATQTSNSGETDSPTETAGHHGKHFHAVETHEEPTTPNDTDLNSATEDQTPLVEDSVVHEGSKADMESNEDVDLVDTGDEIPGTKKFVDDASTGGENAMTAESPSVVENGHAFEEDIKEDPATGDCVADEELSTVNQEDSLKSLEPVNGEDDKELQPEAADGSILKDDIILSDLGSEMEPVTESEDASKESVADEVHSTPESPEPAALENSKDLDPVSVEHHDSEEDSVAHETSIDSPDPLPLLEQGIDLETDPVDEGSLADEASAESSKSPQQREEGAEVDSSATEETSELVAPEDLEPAIVGEEASEEVSAPAELVASEEPSEPTALEDDKVSEPAALDHEGSQSESAIDEATSKEVPLETLVMEDGKELEVDPTDKEVSKEENVVEEVGAAASDGPAPLEDDKEPVPVDGSQEESVADEVTSIAGSTEPTPVEEAVKEESPADEVSLVAESLEPTSPVEETSQDDLGADEVGADEVNELGADFPSIAESPQPNLDEKDVSKEESAADEVPSNAESVEHTPPVEEALKETSVADEVFSTAKSPDTSREEIEADGVSSITESPEPTSPGEEVAKDDTGADEVLSSAESTELSSPVEEAFKEDTVADDVPSIADSPEPTTPVEEASDEVTVVDDVPSLAESPDHPFLVEEASQEETLTDEVPLVAESPELTSPVEEGYNEESGADEVSPVESFEPVTPEEDKVSEPVPVNDESSNTEYVADESSTVESPEHSALEEYEDLEPAHLGDESSKEENFVDGVVSPVESSEPSVLDDNSLVEPLTVDEEGSREESIADDSVTTKDFLFPAVMEDDKSLSTASAKEESSDEEIVSDEIPSVAETSVPSLVDNDKNLESVSVNEVGSEEQVLKDGTVESLVPTGLEDGNVSEPAPVDEEVTKVKDEVNEADSLQLSGDERELPHAAKDEDTDLEPPPVEGKAFKEESVTEDVASAVEAPEALENNEELELSKDKEASKEESVPDEMRSIVGSAEDDTDLQPPPSQEEVSKEETGAQDVGTALPTALEDEEDLMPGPGDEESSKEECKPDEMALTQAFAKDPVFNEYLSNEETLSGGKKPLTVEPFEPSAVENEKDVGLTTVDGASTNEENEDIESAIVNSTESSPAESGRSSDPLTATEGISQEESVSDNNLEAAEGDKHLSSATPDEELTQEENQGGLVDFNEGSVDDAEVVEEKDVKSSEVSDAGTDANPTTSETNSAEDGCTGNEQSKADAHDDPTDFEGSAVAHDQPNEEDCGKTEADESAAEHAQAIPDPEHITMDEVTSQVELPNGIISGKESATEVENEGVLPYQGDHKLSKATDKGIVTEQGSESLPDAGNISEKDSSDAKAGTVTEDEEVVPPTTSKEFALESSVDEESGTSTAAEANEEDLQPAIANNKCSVDTVEQESTGSDDNGNVRPSTTSREFSVETEKGEDNEAAKVAPSLKAVQTRDLDFGALQRHSSEVQSDTEDVQKDQAGVPVSTHSNDLSSSWVSVSPTRLAEAQSRSGDSVASVSQQSQSSPEEPPTGDGWRIVSEQDLSPEKTPSRDDTPSGGTKFALSVVLWCSQSLSSLFGR